MLTPYLESDLKPVGLSMVSASSSELILNRTATCNSTDKELNLLVNSLVPSHANGLIDLISRVSRTMKVGSADHWNYLTSRSRLEASIRGLFRLLRDRSRPSELSILYRMSSKTVLSILQ